MPAVTALSGLPAALKHSGQRPTHWRTKRTKGIAAAVVGPVSFRRQGFTLVELVAVIVVLSILAAVMLPRFFDATDEAHESAMKGINGAFSTAVSSARAQWLAEGGVGNTVNFDGVTLPVNPAGWPTPVAGLTDCIALWDGLLQNPPPAIPFSGPFTADDGFWAFTSSNPVISLCLYLYRPSYPSKLMWIAYYANHPSPQFDGRIITSGF